MDPLRVPAQQETKLHFLDYWRIIRIRKTVILAVFLLVVITATLVTFILPESYSSTARIKVRRDNSDISGLAERPAMLGYDPYFIQSEFEAIQSEVIMGKVIDLLSLNDVWGKKYGGGDKLKTVDTMAILKGRMDLRPVRNTDFLEIRVYSEDKEEAPRIANAIAEVYKEYRQQERLRLARGGIKALEDRYQEQQDKVRKGQAELETLRASLNISDMDASGMAPTPLMEAETVRKLQTQVIEAEPVLIGEEVTLGKARARSSDELKQVLPRIRPDELLSQYLSQLNVAEQSLVRLNKDLSPDHPEVKRVQAQVDDLNQKVEKSVKGIMDALDTQVTAARAEYEELTN